jgi:hypothetical protein
MQSFLDRLITDSRSVCVAEGLVDLRTQMKALPPFSYGQFLVMQGRPDVRVAPPAGAGRLERGVRPHCSTSLLGVLAYRLDAVTLRVHDEGCEVVRPIVSTQPGRAIVSATCSKRRRMKGTHCSPGRR